MKNFCVGVLLLMISGCSAVMALQDKSGPDLTQIKKGDPRRKVEKILGRPFHTELTENDIRIDTYLYSRGLKASKVRAIKNLIMSGISFGMAEASQIPEEKKGVDEYFMGIAYDKNDRVISFESYYRYKINPSTVINNQITNN